mgnify:CR=1 FL=1
MPPSEGRFYVEYLGWKETWGLYGSDFTDPIVHKLLTRRQSQLHRMTIKVGKEKLQIYQNTSGSRGRSQKVRYPSVPLCDVSYVTQSLPPNADVVSCIFLGYNTHTRSATHVHAYRFDSPETAGIFIQLLASLIDVPEFKQRILAMERDLSEFGYIRQERTSSGSTGSEASNGPHSPNSSDSGYYGHGQYPTAEQALKQRKDIVIKRSSKTPVQPSAQQLNSIHAELEQKLSLQNQRGAAILLPPKDYDTIVRRHGHLSIRAKVKPRSVVGAESIFAAEKPAGDSNNNRRSAPVRRMWEERESEGGRGREGDER